MALDNYTIRGIEKVLQPHIGGSKITKVNLSRLSAPGENYLSLVFRVDVEVVNENGKSETVSVVAKRLPLFGEKKPEFDFNAVAMKNEIKWYADIIPIYKEFARDYHIDSNYFPDYLGSRLSLNHGSEDADADSVLLVRNLIPEGYINEDRHVGFDLHAAKSTLKALAAFHATCLGLKYKRPEKFAFIKKFLEDSAPKPPPPSSKDHKPPGPSEGFLLEKIIEFPSCKPYKNQLEQFKNNLNPMTSMFSGGGIEPWATVVHSDFWVNNIMVSKTRSDPQRCPIKILDFQVCHYSTYAKDVLFFLLTSLRDEVLRQSFDDLAKFYYHELISLLSKLDIPELRLTYDEYLEELDRVAKTFEVMHSLFFCNVIFGPKNNVPDHLTGEVDMDDHMQNMLNNLGERAKQRMTLIVETAVEKGWI